jgi:inner membrane protein
MDSLTQLALGAGVAAAALGPRIGPRKAVLVGAVLGTAPDLDVFVPLGDPVADFVLHRGPTHSLFVQALVTPLFAEPLIRLFDGLRGERVRTYLAVYLCFVTHALIDAITIYGTRIVWPVIPEPFGVGSMFIIDPLYTIPLLVILVWALALGTWTPRFARATTVALVVSTAYLGWSMVGQQIAQARGEAALARLGVDPERVIASPTPFNTLYWRVLAVERDRYVNLYLPLFGGDDAITAYAHPRGGHLEGCAAGIDKARDLMAFSKGFFKLDEVEGRLRVSDLRMGLTPQYVFSFDVAETGEAGTTPIHPVRHRPVREAGDDLDWLFAGLRGERAVRTAEASSLIAPGDPAVRLAGPTARSASACSLG